MPYLVTRLKPRERKIDLETLLMGMVTEHMMRPVTNAEQTGTHTYFYKSITPERIKQLNIPAQIQALELFYERNKHLLDELEDPLYNHQLQADLVKRYGNHNIEQIKEELDKNGYHYGDIYETFYVPKKSSKPGHKKWRQIDAPRDDLKNALTILKSLFEAMMDGCFYHNSAFAYVPKRCAKDAVVKHGNNKSNWFMKLDFSNFFGNTTPEFIMRMLTLVFPFSEIIKIPEGKSALKNCIRFCVLDGGLPQGTPMSPTLTNIIMIPIDHKLSNALHHKKETSPKGYEYGYIYTRYADDICVSNRVKFDFKKIEAYVNKVLDHFKAPFQLNPEKTQFGSIAGANWMLGCMLNQEHEITVGHRRRKRLKAMITNYMMDRRHEKPWALEDVQALNGEISYCKSIEKENIEQLLDNMSKKFGDISECVRSDLRKTG